MALGSLEVLSHRIFETKCVTQFLKADISKVRDRRATAQGQERSTFDHCPRVNGSPLKSVPRRFARCMTLQKVSTQHQIFVTVFQGDRIVSESFNNEIS